LNWKKDVVRKSERKEFGYVGHYRKRDLVALRRSQENMENFVETWDIVWTFYAYTE
jgi:hypothetical protein